MRQQFVRVVSFLTILVGGLASIVGSGGGGDGGGGGGGGGSSERYTITFGSTGFESYVPPFGVSSIRGVSLLLDGRVIASRAYSPPTSLAVISGIPNQSVAAGTHTLEFRITDQTSSPLQYAVNTQSFLLVSDTQSSYTKTVVLNNGSPTNPYSANLATGQGISIQFQVP